MALGTLHMNEPVIDMEDSVRALYWSGDRLSVLDQRILPDQIRYEVFDTAKGVAEAIRSMRVRGAPAIGIAAAFGVVLAARQRYRENPQEWRLTVMDDIRCLAESRPTAVNLFWALGEMQRCFDGIIGDPEPVLLEHATAIHEQDVQANLRMGELGSAVLSDAAGVLTHCNAGALATGGYGTALGVIRSGYRKGIERVFATETRPWNQGARLTAWEFHQDCIPVTMVADSAAASLMATGQVQWVVVGADRIAANGDVANKIGTYSLAVLARHHGVRFMVVAPTSTIDRELESGRDIVIEEREQSELLPRYYLDNDSCVEAWNPVFDTTPANLIDAIVTERGVVHDPDLEGMQRLFGA